MSPAVPTGPVYTWSACDEKGVDLAGGVHRREELLPLAVADPGHLALLAVQCPSILPAERALREEFDPTRGDGVSWAAWRSRVSRTSLIVLRRIVVSNVVIEHENS